MTSPKKSPPPEVRVNGLALSGASPQLRCRQDFVHQAVRCDGRALVALPEPLRSQKAPENLGKSGGKLGKNGEKMEKIKGKIGKTGKQWRKSREKWGRHLKKNWKHGGFWEYLDKKSTRKSPSGKCRV
jgi:hypothetical protein